MSAPAPRERIRSIDLHNLSDDQADLVAKQVGDKIAALINDTAEKARGILGIYGLDIKMVYNVFEKGQDPSPEVIRADAAGKLDAKGGPKKPRKRNKKSAN